MAEPWGRAVRIFAGGPRPPAARLRSRSAGAPALERCERLARDRRDRHLPLPPRSLGRPRSVGLGDDVGPRAGTTRSPSSGSRPAAARSWPRSARALARPTCSSACSSRWSTRKARSSRRLGSGSSRQGFRTTRCRRSASASRTARGRSRTRATPGRAIGSRGSRRGSISSCARRRWSVASWTGSRGVISRPRKPWPRSKHRARSGSCSRIARRSSPWIDGLEQAHDGLQLDV